MIPLHSLTIHGIPALLWGQPTNQVYLYIHGQQGNKEEARLFAEIAGPAGWQVLSIDLPAHGERPHEQQAFDPWHVLPELTLLLNYAKQQWNTVSLLANSIGAWFSLLSIPADSLTDCLLVSPVLDMEQLIKKMMAQAEVSEEQLQQEKVITTSFGQTLSWKYYHYACTHPITEWTVPTRILYGGQDHLTERSTIEDFTKQFACDVTVLETCEHWFHTEEQLAYLQAWFRTSLGCS